MNRVDFWAEWISTTVLIVGVALTAFNIYPLNVYVSLAGNAGWLLVGYMWGRWSLIVVQLVVSAVYLAGLVQYFNLI